MSDESIMHITRALEFRLATEKHEKAYAEYNFSGAMLENASIEKRNAELGSQAFEFVAKGELARRFGSVTEREREIAWACARYVVFGRTD